MEHDARSPLVIADQALTALTCEPNPLALDADEVGFGPAGEMIGLAALRERLRHPATPVAAKNQAWRVLVERAQHHGGTWTIGAVGVALGPLVRLATELANEGQIARADLDAEVLSGFLAGLAGTDPTADMLFPRLLRAAREAGLAWIRHLRAADTPLCDLDDYQSAAPPPPWGHPDLVLADAVDAGVITTGEAWLIGTTRLDGISLTTLAAREHTSPKALQMRRRRAEKRLAAALLAGGATDPHDWANDPTHAHALHAAGLPTRVRITRALRAPRPHQPRPTTNASAPNTPEPAAEVAAEVNGEVAAENATTSPQKLCGDSANSSPSSRQDNPCPAPAPPGAAQPRARRPPPPEGGLMTTTRPVPANPLHDPAARSGPHTEHDYAARRTSRDHNPGPHSPDGPNTTIGQSRPSTDPPGHSAHPNPHPNPHQGDRNADHQGVRHGHRPDRPRGHRDGHHDDGRGDGRGGGHQSHNAGHGHHLHGHRGHSGGRGDDRHGGQGEGDLPERGHHHSAATSKRPTAYPPGDASANADTAGASVRDVRDVRDSHGTGPHPHQDRDKPAPDTTRASDVRDPAAHRAPVTEATEAGHSADPARHTPGQRVEEPTHRADTNQGATAAHGANPEPHPNPSPQADAGAESELSRTTGQRWYWAGHRVRRALTDAAVSVVIGLARRQLFRARSPRTHRATHADRSARPAPRRRHRIGWWLLLAVVWLLVLTGDTAPAHAQQHAAALAESTQILAQGQTDGIERISQVLTNLRNWVMGVLAVLATVFLTFGGVRYLMAGGDPGEVDAAKRCFKCAGVGYALAALAPIFTSALLSIVGTVQ